MLRRLAANPGNTNPSLADVGFRHGHGVRVPQWQVITATYGTGTSRPIDALSALFTHDAIFNSTCSVASPPPRPTGP